MDSILWSPRVGFSWDMLGTGKTVVSGGIGLFYDNPAAGLVDNLLLNPPSSVSLRVRSPDLVTGVAPFDPNGAPASWAASAAAFNINQSYNQIQTTLTALGAHLTAPNVNGIIGTIHSPEWQEWNLSVQQELNRSTSFIINYAGNHGARISYFTGWPNAYDGTGGFYSGTVPSLQPRVTDCTVTEYRSGAVSNYNGLTFSLRKQFTNWVSAHVNYTFSHNIDETSNGGLFQYGFEGNNTILGQIYPNSLRTDNYGNSDYDVRHLVNGDFVVNPTFHKTGALKWVVEGWQFSGKMFWRTGLPYTIADGNLTGTVVNGGDTIPAIITGNVNPSACGGGNASFDGLGKPGCLSPNGLVDVNDASVASINFSTQRRNQYRGPHYFDMDLNLFIRTSKLPNDSTWRLACRPSMHSTTRTLGCRTGPTSAVSREGLQRLIRRSEPSIRCKERQPARTETSSASTRSPRVVQLSAKIVF